MLSGDTMKILNILAKSKKAIGGIIAIILFIVAVFYAGMLFGSKDNEPEVTSTTLKNQIVEINELAVYSYDYSKVGKFSNNLTFYGWDVPLTQKSFLITYNGTMKAGIDLKKTTV